MASKFTPQPEATYDLVMTSRYHLNPSVHNHGISAELVEKQREEEEKDDHVRTSATEVIWV